MKVTDSYPISEGMLYGPFAPPEISHNPATAEWLMESAAGDPSLYQLKSLAYYNHMMVGLDDYILGNQNVARLGEAIHAAQASFVVDAIAKTREGFGRVVPIASKMDPKQTRQKLELAKPKGEKK